MILCKNCYRWDTENPIIKDILCECLYEPKAYVINDYSKAIPGAIGGKEDMRMYTKQSFGCVHGKRRWINE